MTTVDIEAIRKDLNEINSFVRDRLDPVSSEVELLKEETERLGRSLSEIQERDRAARRASLLRRTEEDGSLTVPEGPYAGMDVLDLALVRRFAYSQRREAFGPAWMARAEEAVRLLRAAATRPPSSSRTRLPPAGWRSGTRSAAGGPASSAASAAPCSTP